MSKKSETVCVDMNAVRDQILALIRKGVDPETAARSFGISREEWGREMASASDLREGVKLAMREYAESLRAVMTKKCVVCGKVKAADDPARRVASVRILDPGGESLIGMDGNVCSWSCLPAALRRVADALAEMEKEALPITRAPGAPEA